MSQINKYIAIAYFTAVWKLIGEWKQILIDQYCPTCEATNLYNYFIVYNKQPAL